MLATTTRRLGAVLLLLASAAAPAQDTTLAPVTVETDAERREGYRAGTTRAARVLQDPHELPQSLTTVTQSLLEDQRAGSLREALRNVAGVSFNAPEGGRSGDNMNLRGFYTFGDLYLDGIRDTAQYYRETFHLERVEVLRGAAAMLFGRGQAGGVINLVTKMPAPFEQYRLTGALGDFSYRELAADLNRPLGTDHALRVNLMARDEGSWRRNPATGTGPEVHRKGAALSVALNMRGEHRFWLTHTDIRSDDVPDYGVSFDATTRRPSTRLPSSWFWGTERTFDVSTTRMTTLTHEATLAEQTTWRTQLRIADYERSYWAKTPNLTTAPDALALTGGNQTRASDYETAALQSDLGHRVVLGGMPHELLVGVEYLGENSFRHTLRNFGGTTAANPPAFHPFQTSPTGIPVRFKGDSYAIFAQDTVEFLPRWKATLGLRYDRLKATYSSATSPQLRYGEQSARAAVSYHPDAETHYYVAWSDAFSPTADLYQLTVAPLPPERSAVRELGAKWLLAGGDLALRAALYEATKRWERNIDLESTAQVLSKRRRTRGIELEAAGRVTDRWELFAGLALMDARILEVAENVDPTTGAITVAHAGFQGQRARNSPPYSLSVWTTYRVAPFWRLGAGVQASGERYAYAPNSTTLPTLPGQTAFHPNTAPAYARWDALIAYERREWAVRLNVRNLFDKVYFESVYDNGGFTVPGPRRTAILGLEAKL